MLKHALLVSVLLASLAGQAWAVTIEWSTVGNPGNAGELSGQGAGGAGKDAIVGGVDYTYRIATYDVTASQYVEFLNAKDSTGSNPLGLFNPMMSNASWGAIEFNSANADGNKYSAISGRGEHPVNYTTWYNAVRFANWMNNGQGSADTEAGAYTLEGGTPIPSNAQSISRNGGATIFIPSENEWYKAAYFNPNDNSYFKYPTSSNSAPAASFPTGLPNRANIVGPSGPSPLVPTDVGAYTGTTSPYGLFDMGGNIYQWNDTNLGGGLLRGVRGGSFVNMAEELQSSYRFPGDARVPNLVVGFRLATVPEPSSFILAAFGLIGLVVWRRRKR